MKNNSEHISIFGRNRFHDWAVFFIAAIVLVVLGITYSVSTYISTRTLVTDTSSATLVPSRFDAFKENVDFLAAYIEAEQGTGMIVVPQDPSVR